MDVINIFSYKYFFCCGVHETIKYTSDMIILFGFNCNKKIELKIRIINFQKQKLEIVKSYQPSELLNHVIALIRIKAYFFIWRKWVKFDYFNLHISLNLNKTLCGVRNLCELVLSLRVFFFVADWTLMELQF